MNPKTIAAAGAALLLAAGSARADILHYEALLKGANETPPTATHARGELTATLDTDRRMLDYSVTYSGLSGPATAAGFHEHGSAAAPAVAVQAPIQGPDIHASVKLTDSQINDLNAGRWSFNIDTMANPGGEIAGDLRRSSGAY
jgi:hypothetical protein